MLENFAISKSKSLNMVGPWYVQNKRLVAYENRTNVSIKVWLRILVLNT